MNPRVKPIVSNYLSIWDCTKGETIFVGIIQLEKCIFSNLSDCDTANGQRVSVNLGSEKPSTYYNDYAIRAISTGHMHRIR
ncbi:hypothetical protein [uncultured Brevibacillus sp.]|uniref:hypothetical protein n=1 Tax=uncultured Brevibacillus sp. TaxID=169970 RepID=UPI00259258E8|nr:hypothetical protein [uncultured Brevibacillus sp.]